MNLKLSNLEICIKNSFIASFCQIFASNQLEGCLVQVGNCIELDTVGRQFEPYQWRL